MDTRNARQAGRPTVGDVTAAIETEAWARRLLERRATLAAAPDVEVRVVGVWIQPGQLELKVRWFHAGEFKEAYVSPREVIFIGCCVSDDATAEDAPA